MGNTTSSNSENSDKKNFDNFYDIIDYIASYYILTMDFKSLSKLSEKEYCDKLVILTSDIINRHFNDTEITYLAQRIKNGMEVNELSKEKVTYVNKDQLESLDVSNDKNKSVKKRRVCIGIAKFYVKIAHIFAAIVMTINPVYMYKDSYGNTVKTGLMEKDKIPKNVQTKLYKLNICDNRIRALKKGEFINETTKEVTMQPKVCDMNVNQNGSIKSLADEPGINELMKLYLDDNYDYSNGLFTGMSETTKGQYMRDLKTFYTAFTGNETMPNEITKFSDIKLRDYKGKIGCQGNNPILKNKYTLSSKDELFVKYATNIKNMIETAANNQKKLLSVINDLFIFIEDPYTKKKKIRVNPKLTEELLQKSVEKTRRLIIDLYVKCEMDYVTGVKIYEAIVESKILETTQKQIENLKLHAEKIISDTNKTATSNTSSFINNNNLKINPNITTTSNPISNQNYNNLPNCKPTTYIPQSNYQKPIYTSSYIPGNNYPPNYNYPPNNYRPNYNYPPNNYRPNYNYPPNNYPPNNYPPNNYPKPVLSRPVQPIYPSSTTTNFFPNPN
jgi:hypothetical protein